MAMEQTPQSRFRRHRGATGAIERVLLVFIPIVGAIGIVDVFLFFRIGVWVQQYLAGLLALALAVTPLIAPASKRSSRDRLPWYDAVLSIAGLAVGLYLVIFYPELQLTLGLITLERVILGAAAILLLLESCRRLFGWALVIITVTFFLYARFGYVVPGALYIRGIPWERIVTHLYIDSESLLGIPFRVTGTIVLAFIFFGRALFATGGGKFISDAAMSLMGRFRGGAAKVAVVASTGFGTLSGSAVANVATTGVVTIPLIKRSGYRPHFAGAVEATASSGGQIMPPVMGAAAFIMATFLGIRYVAVVLAAIVPAILYYIGVFMQVDLEAAKRGIRGLPPSELPSFKRVIMDGWLFIIPVLVIIYTLFILFLDPDMAGLYATGSVFIVAMFKEASRINLRKLLAIFEDAGEGMLDILIIAGVAGLIIGVVFLTGLGNSFTQFLLELGEGNLLLLLLVAAGAAIVLGMGMTVTAAYIIVVILLAPALIQAGVVPIVAHMFVFYFAVLSFLTPPICVAVYAAASIAGSEPIRTALQAMRLGIVAYIVPFAFALTPALLLKGSPTEILPIIILAILGVMALSVGVEGYLFRNLNWFKRILFIGGAIGLLSPLWILRGVGAAIIITLLLIEWRANMPSLAGAGESANSVNHSQ